MSFLKKISPNSPKDPNAQLKKHFSDMSDTNVSITKPTNFQSTLSVKYDSDQGMYSGIPKEWKHIFPKNQIHQTDAK